MALTTETARYTQAFLTFIGGSLLTLLLVMAFSSDSADFLQRNEVAAGILNLVLFVIIYWGAGAVLSHVEREAREDERTKASRAQR